jgi:two-component system LytT family response regulator
MRNPSYDDALTAQGNSALFGASVPYRVLVVDDERIARAGLRAMLGAHPEFTVVGEAANGVEAAAAIAQLNVALVFLDIHMPDRDGFRMLAQLAPAERPAVVFVTAHRQYALEAFGMSAIDYLLKPFTRERLALTVRRAVQFLRGAAPAAQQVSALIGNPNDQSRTRRLLVRDRDRTLFVDPFDVRWFEVYGNYVRLACDHPRRLLLRSTLAAVAAQLDAVLFVRISRSIIVNVQQVQRIRHYGNGQYELIVDGGVALKSSRRYRREVRAILAPIASPHVDARDATNNRRAFPQNSDG